MQDEDIDSAVAAGILDAERAEALRAHLRQRQAMAAAAAPSDDERFRLLSGFNDVFVVVATLVLLGASYYLLQRQSVLLADVSHFLLSWALAEYFVRHRRLALPGVVLSLSGALGLGGLGFQLLIDPALQAEFSTRSVFLVGLNLANIGTGLGLALAALLQGLRFRAPINGAIGAGGLALAAMCSIREALGTPLPAGLMVGTGLALLLLAMWLDARDRERRSLRADAAFWLHLLAAPWLVHSLFMLFETQDAGSGQTLAIVGLYLLLGLVSLLLDRRALLLAGLGYVLYALTHFFAAVEPSNRAMAFSVAALVVGSSLLLLAARWQPTRRLLLRATPVALTRWLPVA